MTAVKKINPDDPNVRDPKHAHELGGTLGMTVGGLAGGIAGGAASILGATAAGAATGSVAGPVGIVAGAAIGGAIGGSLGEATAREVNPTLEEQYWEKNYHTRPYIAGGVAYESYRPAYRSGIDSYRENPHTHFDEIEPKLRNVWTKVRGESKLEWNDAEPAARDAFNRLSERKK